MQISNKKLQIATFCFLAVSQAHATNFTDGCVKTYLFHLAGNITNDVKSALTKMCACQENALLSAGISQAEMTTFARGAGTGKIDQDAAKVAPRINAIIQSSEVKKRCGGF
jgi:hypothetical protein